MITETLTLKLKKVEKGWIATSGRGLAQGDTVEEAALNLLSLLQTYPAVSTEKKQS